MKRTAPIVTFFVLVTFWFSTVAVVLHSITEVYNDFIDDDWTINDVTSSWRINLKNGQIKGYSEYIPFVTGPQKPKIQFRNGSIKVNASASSLKGDCNTQAVLALHLSRAFSSVHFRLLYHRPRLWTFHASQNRRADGYGRLVTTGGSDSSITMDHYPNRTGMEEAELQVHNRQLRFYAGKCKTKAQFYY